jgi:hypothetical protein
MTVIDSHIGGSRADSAGSGGGIANNGTMTVIDSTFTGNSATFGGGIENGGTATLTSCTFTGNSASSGGGIENDGTATLTNCTVSGNTGLDGGGGISNYNFLLESATGGTLTLTNCTVTGNSAADGYGGGIGNGVSVGYLTLDNTIVAGNRSMPSRGNDIYGRVQSTSGFNLIGDGSGISNLTDLENPALSNLIGTTASPLNPLLGPLADNGGPTQTMALLPGSPAIDAGSDALAVDGNGNPLL